MRFATSHQRHHLGLQTFAGAILTVGVILVGADFGSIWTQTIALLAGATLVIGGGYVLYRLRR